MFEKIIPLIKSAKRIGIVTHINPDGDALGSAYALKLILQSMGYNAEVYLETENTSKLYSLIKKGKDADFLLRDCDLKIAVDCAEQKRLRNLLPDFLNGNTTICIDHHVTHKSYTDIEIVDGQCASCGELIFGFMKEFGGDLTPDVANNLYIAIVTDTGMFKYQTVSGSTMRIAGELMDTGIDFTYLCAELFDRKSMGYYTMLRIGLEGLELLCDGRLAVMSLRNEDFVKAGVDEASVDGLIDYPRNIEGVEVALYIRDRISEDGTKIYRISIRSNTYMDVGEIALMFGGGGHMRAAGIETTDPNVRSKLLQEIEKRLK